jgi:hypothetical protein
MNTCTTRAPRPGRLPIVDLIAMVILAVAVGLGTGVVLGGTVLLLTDHDQMAASALAVPTTGVPSH